MIVSTSVGLFGPFAAVNMLDDRLVCDGADLPFTVIGAYEIVDPPLPDGFYAPDYSWADGELIHSAPALTGPA
ncbi:hypothetical protein [Rugamonas sp.]|uniref:hypothetical protein n=1 Tax=Rugamonas sp. TaxID=1926287 RepID=UPI0025F209C0|nr:hypothetical protein [Rugamonas sp.]